MNRIKSYLLAGILCLACALTAAAAPMTQEEIDAKWKELTAASAARREGAAKAAALSSQLDAKATKDGDLFDLWNRMNAAKDGDQRLDCAWSIIRFCVPNGDISRWNEVNYFELPSFTPRPLMVIDAFYCALIELPQHDGGVWLAADLLRQFSRSSHGRFDFIGVCPAPVAEAVENIASAAGLIGIWTPRQVVGTLPIARGVHGAITMSLAVDEGMQFLDGAGVPSGNGFYAWDRKTGDIYKIIISGDPFFIPND